MGKYCFLIRLINVDLNVGYLISHSMGGRRRGQSGGGYGGKGNWVFKEKFIFRIVGLHIDNADTFPYAICCFHKETRN